MRIRAKFTLLQLTIILGFTLSLSFVLLRFFQATTLKELEFEALSTLTELRKFEYQTESFSSRNDGISILWEQWNTSYSAFDNAYTSLLTDSAYAVLGDDALIRRDSRAESWNAMKLLEIEPLRTELQAVVVSDIRLFAQERSITATREIIGAAEGFDSPRANELAAIDSRFRNLSESMTASITIPTERFIADIRAEVEQFASGLLLATLGVALVVQFIGMLIGLRFSGVFSRYIIQLERNLAEVANGNFDVNLDIRTGDEFEDISRHFNLLTQDLWTRLDSMKDMMRDIGGSTGEGADLGDLEEFMLELAIDNTGAEAGFLMKEDDGMLILNKTQGYFPPPMSLPPMVASKREYVEEWFATHRIAPGEGILGQVLAHGEARFVRNNADGELPDNADKESDLYINSAMFIPLNISGATFGVLGLVLTQEGSVFTDLDYSYMQSYGEFIALTMDNMHKYLALVKSHQINREIEVAADIQKTLLPEKMPVLSGAEVAAFSDAAKGVSGDYYDVFDLGSEKTALVICDVAGKGVPASLLMIMIRTVIRTISTPDKKADVIMKELNRAITGRLGADRFATISLIILDRKTSAISYSNGAHHPLYILRGENKKYRMFDTDGLPLGIDINASFGHKKIRVKNGDYLILFTDGLPEARNNDGEELGTDRLLRFVARHSDQTPKEMTRRVKDYLDDFTSGGAQHDDQTFLVLRVS